MALAIIPVPSYFAMEQPGCVVAVVGAGLAGLSFAAALMQVAGSIESCKVAYKMFVSFFGRLMTGHIAQPRICQMQVFELQSAGRFNVCWPSALLCFVVESRARLARVVVFEQSLVLDRSGYFQLGKLCCFEVWR